MRFWDPDTGRITLNGADLRDYKLDELRGLVALVAQDTYLFNDTLRANILIARPEATEAEPAGRNRACIPGRAGRHPPAGPRLACR